jgi:hypothetical protein
MLLIRPLLDSQVYVGDTLGGLGQVGNGLVSSGIGLLLIGLVCVYLKICPLKMSVRLMKAAILKEL